MFSAYFFFFSIILQIIPYVIFIQIEVTIKFVEYNCTSSVNIKQIYFRCLNAKIQYIREWIGRTIDARANYTSRTGRAKTC